MNRLREPIVVVALIAVGVATARWRVARIDAAERGRWTGEKAIELSSPSLDELIKAVASAGGPAIRVDDQALAAARVSRTRPLCRQLRLMKPDAVSVRWFFQHGRYVGPRLNAFWFDGAIEVTSGNAPEPLVCREYDVSELLPFSGDSRRQWLTDGLERLIMETIAPDTWICSGGSGGSLVMFGDHLFVWQSAGTQLEVESLLIQLSETRPCRPNASVAPDYETRVQ